MSETDNAGDRQASAEPPPRAALVLAARARRPATSAVTVPVPVTVTAMQPPGDPLPAASVSSTADLVTAIEGPQPPPVVPARAPQAAPSDVPGVPSRPAATVPPVPTVVGSASEAAAALGTESATKNDLAPQHRPQPVPAEPPRGRPQPPPVQAPARAEPLPTARDEKPMTARAVRPPAADPAESTARAEPSALLERARRATTEPSEEAEPQRLRPVQLDTARVATAVRENEPAPREAASAQPLPPVTIGEIHIHEAAHADPAADPLALLAPYAGGLTARRGGMNAPAGAG